LLYQFFETVKAFFARRRLVLGEGKRQERMETGEGGDRRRKGKTGGGFGRRREGRESRPTIISKSQLLRWCESDSV